MLLVLRYTGQLPLHKVFFNFRTVRVIYQDRQNFYRNRQDCLMFHLQWVLKLQCTFSVEFGEKQASVCVESSGTAYNHHMYNSVYLLTIVSMPFDHAHYALACNFCSCAQTSQLAWSKVVSCPVSF